MPSRDGGKTGRFAGRSGRGGGRPGRPARAGADAAQDGRSRTDKRAPVDPARAHDDLVGLLRASYDDAVVASVEEGWRAKRPVTLRANALKASAEEVADALSSARIPFERVSWYADAFVLPGATEQEVRGLPLYEEGKVYLQSLSSMVPPLVLAPCAGQSVLDMAAAPGGKTTQIAALTSGRAQVTACERSTPRSERLRFNLERQGAGRVNVLVQDARRLDPFFRFERILLDAPCSGSGTVSFERTGDGEGSWKTGFSLDLLERCRRTQEGLLRKALELLPPGGELVYSTCSVLPQENDRLVESVLSGEAGSLSIAGRRRAPEGADRDARFAVVPVDPAAFPGVPLLPCGLEGALCIRPSERYEGFFVCRLRRVR